MLYSVCLSVIEVVTGGKQGSEGFNLLPAKFSEEIGELSVQDWCTSLVPGMCALLTYSGRIRRDEIDSFSELTVSLAETVGCAVFAA